MELNWCFDFRPNNTLLKELKFHLKKFNNLKGSLIATKTLWYIYTGLTEDIINKSYVSNEETYNERDKNGKKIHFNNVPVVNYNKDQNNSFLWQGIPDSLISEQEDINNISYNESNDDLYYLDIYLLNRPIIQ